MSIYSMPQGYVYIIQSKSTLMYYIGASEDTQCRLKQHNQGLVTATRNKGPWQICFKKLYPSINKAKQVEYKLKKFKRRDILYRIIADNDIKIS